jgi:hypothetical protein
VKRWLSRTLVWFATAASFAAAGGDLPSGSLADLAGLLLGVPCAAQTAGSDDDEDAPATVTAAAPRVCRASLRQTPFYPRLASASRPGRPVPGPSPDSRVPAERERLNGVGAVLRC